MRIENGASGGGERAERPDLQAVLLHYGLDAPSPGNYLCVIHDETTPSMSVNLDKGLVNCMSCGFAGSSWDVIMTKEDFDFRSAVSYAADAGFESEPSDRGGKDVQSVLGRRRASVPRAKGDRRADRWRRPW